MKTTILSLIGVLCVTVLSQTSFAQTIKTVKGSKVLVELQGVAVEPGQDFFAVDAAGKKRAIIKIKQVKNDKAVGDILKGKAEVGQTLQGRKGALTAGGSSSSSGTSRSSSRHNGAWGILGSYGMDKMDASFTYAGTNYTAGMQGTGFGLLGYYELPMSSEFILRGVGGLEQFVASTDLGAANVVCGTDANGVATTSSCNVNITYLSMYGTARYNLVNGSAKVWVGAGLGYLFAASKSSSVLKTDNLSTYVIVPSFGVDIPVGKNIIPVVLDYVMFPDSSTVKASAISLRFGYGWYF